MAISLPEFGGEVNKALELLNRKWGAALNVAISQGVGEYKIRVHTKGQDVNGNALSKKKKKYHDNPYGISKKSGKPIKGKKSGLVPKTLTRTRTLQVATKYERQGDSIKAFIDEVYYLNRVSTVDVMGFHEEKEDKVIGKFSKGEVKIVVDRILSELKL